MLLDFEKLYTKYNLNVKGVIHIGGHFGEEDIHYRRRNISNVMYFEPLKKNFDVLKRNVSDKAIVYNLALGNEEKTMEMFVESVNQGMSSSLLKPKEHLSQYPHIVFDSTELVEVKKLDNIVFDRENYNLINIDVQGYELEVFKGGENTLNHIDYIITEINKVHLYEDGALLENLIHFLSKYNFKMVEENWAGGTWGDGFFIKNK